MLGAFAALFLLAGCQENIEKTVAEVKEKVVTRVDLDNYLEKSNKIIEKAHMNDAEYEIHYAEETDLEKALTYLKEDYLPTVQALEKEVREIELSSNGLMVLRDELTKIYQKDIEYANKLIEAFEANDEALLEEADHIMEEQLAIATKYDEKIVEFAKKHGIDLTLE